MVTSLFKHERIITTKQKGKELKRISERLITRARKNLELTDDQVGEKLHNKRIIMKSIHNTCVEHADRFGTPGNYVNGANIGGFLKVADAIIDQGVV